MYVKYVGMVDTVKFYCRYCIDIGVLEKPVILMLNLGQVMLSRD